MNCCICNKQISGRYYIDWWGNKIHAAHYENNEYNKCCACNRFVGNSSTKTKSKSKGYTLKDGRVICGICSETSVYKKSQIKNSFDFVVSLLNNIYIDIGIDNITIELVDKLNDNIRGICHSAFIKAADGTNSEVKSNIKILTAFPKILFESILAHEILHHWIFSNDIKDNKNIEGFCNIGAALVTNYYYKRKRSKLAEYLIKLENENPDYYYGKLFVRLKKKLNKKGWKAFINEIKTKKVIKL